jgi:hypothetical protein
MDHVDVWPRFERLAETCTIKVDHLGEGWQVMVHPRGRAGTVVGGGDNLLSAVRDALERAEAQGWHLRPPVSGG